MSTSHSMGQPKPKVALDNICSAVYNNTLYTYSADAFQSLGLEKGSQWKTLKQGEGVSGAACVSSSTAFYVVGGTGGSADYKGLQRYTYETGTWESMDPVVPVTQNRTDHGAVYLEGSDSIVVYAGSQAGDTNPSTQTFSISAAEPYSVLAYQNEGAPPTTRPILLRWSDRQAAMVGGSATNTQVMLFTVGAGWSNSGATLASPLKTGTEQWQAVLVTGDDGSKNLITFDMSVSPNVANRTVLIDEHGAPVTKAAAVTKRSDDHRRSGQDEFGRRATALTQENWPSYNSTYASTAIRNNFAAAESDDGQVVLSGGNTDDVLCIFNAKTNSWVNATALLEDDTQKVLSVSSSSSSSTSATATSTTASGTLFATLSPTATPETSAAAGTASTSTHSSTATSSSSSGLGTNGILGVVLGSIGGALVLLILLYCQIRKRKRTQDFIQAGHARRSSGASERPEKEGMAVVTESYPRSPTNPTFMRGHQPKASTGSFSSMAILMGKGPKSSMEGGPRPGSSNKQMKTMGGMGQTAPMRPVPALAPDLREEKGVSFAADTTEPRPGLRVPADQQDGLRRSSGWNRYWSGDSAALNILGYGTGQQTNRNTVASETSHYSNNGPGIDPRYRMTKDSATVPPLNVDDGRPRFNRVNSGSPTVSNYPAAVKQHMSAEYSDRDSRDSFSGYSSGIPASVQDSWDPTAASKPWASGGRATSSMYSNAFPMPPAPSEHRPPMPRNIPSGISQQPQLDTANTSDMSWLNIGQQQQNRN